MVRSLDLEEDASLVRECGHELFISWSATATSAWWPRRLSAERWPLIGGSAAHERAIAAEREHGAGWRVPPNPMPPDTSADDLASAAPPRMMQPLRTFEQKLRLTGAVERLGVDGHRA